MKMAPMVHKHTHMNYSTVTELHDVDLRVSGTLQAGSCDQVTLL